MFYLKQELSRTTTDLRIFQKILEINLKKNSGKVDKIIEKMFKILRKISKQISINFKII